MLGAHRAGVQPCLHVHDGDPRDIVASQDGALNRCSAAPAGQEGGVNVHAAQTRRIKDRARQDQSIGRDHRHVGVQRGEGGLHLGIP